MPTVYVFVNLPHTDGIWITDRLAEHLGWNERLLLLGSQGDRQRNQQGIPDPSVWTEGRLRRIRVITGDVTPSSHDSVGSTGRYLTFLRDPAERRMAEYQAIPEADREHIGFRDWCSTRMNNPQTRRLNEFFGLDNAEAVARALDGFWFVGVTEHYGDDLPRIFDAISGESTTWPPEVLEPGADPGSGEAAEDDSPSSPVPEAQLTDELRDMVYTDNPSDLKLYRYALRRRTQKRKRYGWT